MKSVTYHAKHDEHLTLASVLIFFGLPLFLGASFNSLQHILHFSSLFELTSGSVTIKSFSSTNLCLQICNYDYILVKKIHVQTFDWFVLVGTCLADWRRWRARFTFVGRRINGDIYVISTSSILFPFPFTKHD